MMPYSVQIGIELERFFGGVRKFRFFKDEAEALSYAKSLSYSDLVETQKIKWAHVSVKFNDCRLFSWELPQ